MKARIIPKILFTFVCLCVFASAVAAQEKKPEAILVSEYQFGSESDGEFSAFERMTEQLIFRLMQEPETTVGAINIMERSVMGGRVRAILAKHPKLKNKIRYGSPNENRYVTGYKAGFWLVPLGAEMPDIGSDEPPCICPIQDIEIAEVADSATGNVTFTAIVEGKNQKAIKYYWTISAGKIVEGQNTKTIVVDPQGAKEITATYKISGTCDDALCGHMSSGTVKIR